MKRVLTLVLMLCVLCFSSKGVFAREAVTIKDPYLKKQIMASLKSKNEMHRKMGNIKLTDPNYVKDPSETVVYKSELAMFTHFRSDEAVEDLSGLEYMTELRTLKIFRKSAIHDLTPLKDLTHLEHLWLGNNRIVDVRPLSNLTRLEVLRLENNQIEDIGPIADMAKKNEKLKKLYLYGNRIKDFSGLKDKTFKEKDGFFGYNQTITLKPNTASFSLNLIDEKGKLYDLSDVNVSDTDKLVKESDGKYRFKDAPENTRLRIFSDGLKTQPTWVVDIDASDMGNDPLKTKVHFASPALERELLTILKDPSVRDAKEVILSNPNYVKKPNETFIYEDEMALFKSLTIVNNNEIEDVTGLETATNLESLKLFQNNLKEIRPLAALTKLRLLNLDSNKNIQDFSAIASLSDLENLSLAECNVGYLKPLENLTKLKTLDLNHNNIGSIDALKKLDQLQVLNLDDNLIQNLAPLRGKGNLHSLSLKANEITSVEDLKDLRNLSYLALSKNRITDFSPLKNVFHEVSKVFPHEDQEIHLYPADEVFAISLKDEKGKSYGLVSKRLIDRGNGKYSYAKQPEMLGLEVVDDFYANTPQKNKIAWRVFIHPDTLLDKQKEQEKSERLALIKENKLLKEKLKETEKLIAKDKAKMEAMEKEMTALKNRLAEKKDSNKNSAGYRYVLSSPVVESSAKKDEGAKKQKKLFEKRVFTIGQEEFKAFEGAEERTFKMDVAPYIKNNRTMLPLRYVGESLGLQVDYNVSSKMVILKKGDRTVLIEQGSQVAIASNGDKIALDSPAETLHGRVFIPLSNVNKLFEHGPEITWDSKNRTVTIGG